VRSTGRERVVFIKVIPFVVVRRLVLTDADLSRCVL
jgi:hypothetical protein